jgi:ferredoxin
MVVRKYYSDDLAPFLERIEKLTTKAGVKDCRQYIGEGGWKRRASGNLIDRTSFVDFTSTTPTFVAKVKKPKVDIEAFLPVLGKYALNGSTQSRSGNIKIRENIYDISITEEKSNEIEIKLDNVYDLQLIGQIKKVVWKSTYCVQCEACEVECPTGALTIYPKINIDKDRCVHCHKCLDFHDKGCIAANSLYMTTGSNISKQANIDRYKNFGLKEEWVEAYFVDRDDFWTSNHGLNENYQIPSLKAWLRDAEIIDSSNKKKVILRYVDDEIIINEFDFCEN